MNHPQDGFGDIAQKLARNPLGIIALFIVLVYGLAALVTSVSGSLSIAERLPLIYFLVVFPVLVLAEFGWLVSRHSNKLFAPSDFRDEDNYVRMLTATASLAVASVKGQSQVIEGDLDAVVRSVQEVTVNEGARAQVRGRRGHVLWVDDRPYNNVNERSAFEAMGLQFTLAESTSEALAVLARRQVAAIISDMGRREGPREGYVLLDELRMRGDSTPFFIYASSNDPEHKRETVEHGGSGCTNRPQELFEMVMRAIINA